jgi:hypothetical protein
MQQNLEHLLPDLPHWAFEFYVAKASFLSPKHLCQTKPTICIVRLYWARRHFSGCLK